MIDSHDPRLQLAPPAGRASPRLFLPSVALPVAITAIALLPSTLDAGEPRLIGDSLPLTVAVSLGGVAVWFPLHRVMRRQPLRSYLRSAAAALHALPLRSAGAGDAADAGAHGRPGRAAGTPTQEQRLPTRAAQRRVPRRRPAQLRRHRRWTPRSRDPTSGRHDLLIEPRDPATLPERLQGPASAPGHR